MGLPANAADLFDNQVPAAIAKNPEKAKEINAIYLFKVTGEGGGEWTVDLASATPSVTKGDQKNSQCSIEITHADFMSMLGNPALGMQLYFQGKLKVTGDPMLATKLQKLFQLSA